MFRVSDGTRTRGILDHNQVLYQLSYTHHDRRFVRRFHRPAEKKCTGSEGVPAHAFRWGRFRGRPGPGRRGYRPGRTCFAAIVRAVSESGPGCGTKIASR